MVNERHRKYELKTVMSRFAQDVYEQRYIAYIVVYIAYIYIYIYIVYMSKGI